MITRRRWEAGEKPGEMIRAAMHWAKNPMRKATLYRVALVRRVWDEMPWICRVLTELAERQVDGDFDPSVLPRTLEYIAEGAFLCAGNWDDRATSRSWLAEYERYLVDIGYVKPLEAEPTDSARFREMAWLAYSVHTEVSEPTTLSARRDFHSVPLIRDIFGNPFRPVAFAPEWCTDTAVALARTMYESRDFSAMPILADALQDAGCNNADVLAHCRDATLTHVRGCWVVDLVLCKS